MSWSSGLSAPRNLAPESPAAAPEPDACRWAGRTLKVAPRSAGARGRGLFALAPIAAGELIDAACTAELTAEQCAALEGMLPLGDYYFAHPEDAERGLMLFGLVSLVNHADAPNAEVRHLRTSDLGWVSELRALRAIDPGAEITHRYRCPPWFSVA